MLSGLISRAPQMMSARLRLERAKGMAESLTTMGLPSAVLLGNGKVISTNSSFDQVRPQIVSTAFGGVALANAEANALLTKAIKGLSAAAFQNQSPYQRMRGVDATRRRFVETLRGYVRTAESMRTSWQKTRQTGGLTFHRPDSLLKHGLDRLPER
jgi:hypothetical protein